MELKITTSRITEPITRDGKQTGEISFDPADLAFVEGFVSLIDRYQKLLLEIKAERTKPDGDIRNYLALVRKVSETLCTSIDEIFGEGTSKAAFGGIPASPDVFAQFFDWATDQITASRAPYISKYLPADEEGAEQADGLE